MLELVQPGEGALDNSRNLRLQVTALHLIYSAGAGFEARATSPAVARLSLRQPEVRGADMNERFLVSRESAARQTRDGGHPRVTMEVRGGAAP